MSKKNEVYLGTGKNGWTNLMKHRWDCGWYWGFGYLGNASCHWHFQSILEDHENGTDVQKVFPKSTWISQKQWWIIRDLFVQAYALKKAAETYRYGGHQSSDAEDFRIISASRAKAINEDLGLLLDRIWVMLNSWRAKSIGAIVPTDSTIWVPETKYFQVHESDDYPHVLEMKRGKGRSLLYQIEQ